MEKDIQMNQRVLVRLQKELEQLKKQEAEVRRLWTLGYHKFLNAKRKLEERIDKGLTVDPVDPQGKVNKTVKTLWEAIRGWEERSAQLTRQRDEARLAIEQKTTEILQQERYLDELQHQFRLQVQKTDDMIEKVFLLNEGVITALENMDKFLASHVFPLLPCQIRQKTLENSPSTKKIVIMTNTITVMDVAKVQEASALIEQFFARIAPKPQYEYDETLHMLTNLVKELLDIKIKVKAGPNLSKFLALELDKEKVPELYQAQKLLASAINYQRSGLYVRLYHRSSPQDPWEPVRQS